MTVDVPQKAPSSRLLYLDHLRTFLVTLVVVHHVALVYGGVAPFYYSEYPASDPGAVQVLTVFVLFNQAWFMGALFLLAGYFTPASLDRKGSLTFLKGRLLRLGIPLLFFYFLLNPLCSLAGLQAAKDGGSESVGFSTPAYREVLGLGPTWFLALLLLFSVLYVFWRWKLGPYSLKLSFDGSRFAGFGLVGLLVLLVTLSYLLRREIPIGRSVAGFPTLGYLPQYAAAFVLGILAYRNQWFEKLSLPLGLLGFLIAFVASVALFPLATSGKWLLVSVGPAITSAMGYGLWQSAIYALWDSLVVMGMCFALIPAFRLLSAGDNRPESFFAKHSYAVYLFHIPVIVFLAILMQGWELAPLIKFSVGSLITVPACFVFAFLLRKLPFVDRVL